MCSSDLITAIKAILARSSVRQKEIGALPVTHFTMVDWYDKRTLSPAHMHLFNESFHYKRVQQEAGLFQRCADTRLWESRGESEEARTAFDRRFGMILPLVFLITRIKKKIGIVMGGWGRH